MQKCCVCFEVLFFFFFAFRGEGFEIINSLFDNVLSERGLREICGGILLFKRL